MKPIVEPISRRINLLNAHPRNRNRCESLVALALLAVFLWWLGSHIHAGLMRGNVALIDVRDRVARAVGGE